MAAGHYYGKISLQRQATCHPDLILWSNALLKVCPFDLAILCGYRNERDQMVAYHGGTSKVRYPNSKHNKIPATAIDIAPWFLKDGNVDWDFRPHFDVMAGQGLLVARALGTNLRWGGDWDRDGDLRNNNFNDLVHFELV